MIQLTRRFALCGIVSTLVGCRTLARLNTFYCPEDAGGRFFAYEYPVELSRFQDLIDEGRMVPQQTPELCWAAAIQALLTYNGIDVTQEQVLEYVKGKLQPGAETATIREILRGFSGYFHGWYIETGNGVDVVMNLERGRPVLIGIRPMGAPVGHIVVVYGAMYGRFPNGGMFVDKVKVWDPDEDAGAEWVSGCKIRREIIFQVV